MHPFPDMKSHPLFFFNSLKMNHERNFMATDYISSLGRKKYVVALTKNLKNFLYSAIIIVGLMMGDAVFSMANAQTLGQRPGQTALQSFTGTAVQGVCPRLGRLTSRSALQQDLFETCRALVQTGNDLNGVGGTTFSLGLSNEELNAALQQVAVEEVLVLRTSATKTFKGQLKNLRGRLAALRAGASGFSVSGLNFNGFNTLAGLRSETIGSSGFSPRGGGASGDSDGGGFSRLSAFINGSFGFGDKNETSREDGFNFDTVGVTLGVDYRLLNELILGTAFTYSHFDAEFITSSVNAGGDSQTDGYVFSLYSTYYLKNFYLEGIGSVGWNDHDSQRKIFIPSNTAIPPINRTAKGDTDSTQYSFTVGTGYTAQVGNVDFGPYARLTYFKVDIDGFKETGAQGLNLEVEDQKVTSLISALGMLASKKFSWIHGVWSPQIRGEWDHEYKNDTKTTTTKYVNDPFNTALFIRNESPDRDFFRVGATLANVSAGGTQVFFDFETILGLRDITNHLFTIGARQEF